MQSNDAGIGSKFLEKWLRPVPYRIAFPPIQVVTTHTPAVAIGGDWSDASTWLGGMVPSSDQTSDIVVLPGDTLTVNVGGQDPAVAHDVILLSPAKNPSALVVPDNLLVYDLLGLGCAAPSVTVGSPNFQPPPNQGGPPPLPARLTVAGDVHNVHFIITGIDTNHFIRPVAAALDLEGHFDKSTIFSLTGHGAGAGPDKLILEHPPLHFIRNEIDVDVFTYGSYPNITVASAPAWIELGGVSFDRVAFRPHGSPPSDPTAPVTGTLVLSEGATPVLRLTDVHASHYGGAVGGHFSVGVDKTTGHSYVAYNSSLTS